MIRFDEISRRLGGAMVDHAPLVGGVSARVTALDLALPDGSRRRVVVREPGAAAWKGSGAPTARREFDLPGFLGSDHDALRARLAERPPVLTPRRTLLHGDYWPGNVLWRDGAIVALLDWEDAAVGDPLSDVACCRLELRYVLGEPGAAAFSDRYARRTGVDLDDLPVWDAFVAAAALASMGQWGLPAEREARMRREATASLAAAAARLHAGRHGRQRERDPASPEVEVPTVRKHTGPWAGGR